jgi:hypothetical protein
MPSDGSPCDRESKTTTWDDHAHANFISTTTKPLPDSTTNTDYDSEARPGFWQQVEGKNGKKRR